MRVAEVQSQTDSNFGAEALLPIACGANVDFLMRVARGALMAVHQISEWRKRTVARIAKRKPAIGAH